LKKYSEMKSLMTDRCKNYKEFEVNFKNNSEKMIF